MFFLFKVQREFPFSMRGQGYPIIVLHGRTGLDHGYFLPQLSKLGEDHRLFFFDQRASGKSSAAIDTNSMTIDNFVEDLEGLRRGFHPGKMNLLGHSWSGLVAMFCAVKYPDSLNSLILVNTTPESSVRMT